MSEASVLDRLEQQLGRVPFAHVELGPFCL
jgi:hypothetical protein